MLRHSVPHLPPNFACMLHVEWRNSTPRSTSTPGRRNKNNKLKKYSISSTDDRILYQSSLQASTCAPAPRLASCIKLIFFLIFVYENFYKCISVLAEKIFSYPILPLIVFCIIGPTFTTSVVTNF